MKRFSFVSENDHMEMCTDWHRPQPALSDFSSVLVLFGFLCYCRVGCNAEYHLTGVPGSPPHSGEKMIWAEVVAMVYNTLRGCSLGILSWILSYAARDFKAKVFVGTAARGT